MIFLEVVEQNALKVAVSDPNTLQNCVAAVSRYNNPRCNQLNHTKLFIDVTDLLHFNCPRFRRID